MNLAILQARLSSTRLPGKVLKPILGEPMLLRQIERVKRIQGIDRLIVATTDESGDQPIADLCTAHDIEFFRGDLNDVLKRFYEACASIQPDFVTRLTGDCPLIDPQVAGNVISFFHESGADYATNAVQPTYPDGLDIEIFKFSCLKSAYEFAHLPSEREHVTPWIRAQDVYRIVHYKGDADHSSLRWTVDEQEDFELVTMIYEHLYPRNPEFSFEDILAYLEERPELKTWNTRHERNEGLKKSQLLDHVSA